MKLVEETSDWNLPLAHETYWSGAFMGGGRTFIDIGAHVGTWTLRLAPLFERVFCFEPDQRAYEALRKNIASAGLSNVEVIPKAVSDRTGTAKIMLTPNPCTNTMLWKESERTDATIGEVEVPTVALGDFVRERGITDLDFLKCDAEGAEMLIVDGARDVLREQRPDFFVEMHGLFFRRLRALMPWERCDIIDGGAKGLSLARHRDVWPEFSDPKQFRVYADPDEPTEADYEVLRRLHGLECKAPTSGFLSVEGT